MADPFGELNKRMKLDELAAKQQELDAKTAVRDETEKARAAAEEEEAKSPEIF